MNRPLERKITLGFGAAIAALLLIGAAAWWSAARFKGTVYWVNHTQEVRTALERAFADVLSLQANARGFVLAGDESLLPPYEVADTQLDTTLRQLRELTSDNPRQEERIDQLLPLVTHARAILQGGIAARRARGREPAGDAEFFAASQDIVERIRRTIAAMEEEERRLLADRLARTGNVSRLTVVAIAAAVLLAAGLLLLAGALLRRESEQRTQAEKTIHANEERLRLMFSSVTDYAIIMLDPSGRVVGWNAGAHRIKGYTAEEIVGQHFSHFYPPELLEADTPARALATAEKEGSFQDEGWRVRKDGARFWASVVINALREPNGTLVGFVKITRDLTERHEARKRIEALNADLQRRANDLEAANQELEAFSYSVSHDLRAPLRHVDGFANLLARHADPMLDDQGRRYVQTISRAAKRMGTLIDDLLAFSRIGRTPLRVQNVNHTQLVREVIVEGQYEAATPRVTWEIATLPDSPGDPALLRQVWSNLIGNAVKYSAKNPEPRVAIGGHVEPARDECVYFVRDNGVGFDMAYADKLFGVFQRLHTPAEFEGTGIGLANVRRIVLRHGGRTWAEAQVGAGATFYFSLPVTSPALTASV